MGKLVDGKWTAEEDAPPSSDGRYRRAQSRLRNWVTRDGAAGPSGEGGFAAAAGRYHLYVAYSCPWAHRTMIVRNLKNLAGLVSLTIAMPTRDDEGWRFEADPESEFHDANLGVRHLHQVYTLAEPTYSGRVTVPVLWDKERRCIVNNESSEIIRMFNSAFADLAEPGPDLRPAELRDEIDRVNDRVYASLNNGVYRAGFATRQEAYEEAVAEVFETLDWLEQRLATRRYLAGDRLTEADWRAFPTLARFDTAYFGAFKCNKRRLMDYPNLWNYTRELYQMPGVAETVRPEIFKRGYYSKSVLRNPHGVVPKGPILDFDQPHDRERLTA